MSSGYGFLSLDTSFLGTSFQQDTFQRPLSTFIVGVNILLAVQSQPLQSQTPSYAISSCDKVPIDNAAGSESCCGTRATVGRIDSTPRGYSWEG